ncbi:MAG: PTS system mannose/fructose/sorbose family transporter subunit IID [Longicatena sp.]
MNKSESTTNTPAIITKRDINIAWFRWHAFSETSLNFERLQALAFCHSMSGILEKLYPNKEDLSVALQRHLTMYNTQANWGSIVNGMTIALEEKAASETEETKELTATLVTGLKTGLMGPIAGIGDTLDFGTVRPIVMGICIPFALNGSVIASLIPLVFQVVYMIVTSNLLLNLGYTKGKESIVDVLQSGTIHKVIEGAGMFGLLVMGALSATYVKVSTPLVIATEGAKDIVLQEMIDKIVPNLLPIIVVFAIYLYIVKKGPHYLKILFLILGFSLLFSFLGVL